jgi:hypothetical protein
VAEPRDQRDAENQAAPDKRDWMAFVGLVLVTAMFSFLSPGLLLAVPFALLTLALPPRRPAGIALAAALLVLVLAAKGTGSLWYFERGWTLLLGSWFVVFVMVMPASGFVSRAISAVAATGATVALFLGVHAGGFGQLDAAVRARFTTAAVAASEALKELLRSTDGTMTSELPASMLRMAEVQTLVFPAMLSLVSMAALGAGWWLYSRFAAMQARPLRPLREFRFTDHLVWVAVVGAILLLVPSGAVGTRIGTNLVAFMAALYSLRGMAVLVAISRTPGKFGMVVGAVLFLYLIPLVMAATMIVGLTDTWLDIRAKRPIAPTPGS